MRHRYLYSEGWVRTFYEQADLTGMQSEIGFTYLHSELRQEPPVAHGVPDLASGVFHVQSSSLLS